MFKNSSLKPKQVAAIKDKAPKQAPHYDPQYKRSEPKSQSSPLFKALMVKGVNKEEDEESL